MARKKRNFIDKSKSITFKLVGRAQDDPLFVDETAPQYVLVEKRTKQTIPIDLDLEDGEDGHKNKKLTTDARREEQSKFGIYFDDDYDYLQHLIDAKEVPTLAGDIEIQHSSAKNAQASDIKEDDGEFPELSQPSTSLSINIQKEPSTSKKPPPVLMLPSSVFDSTVQEKESLTKRAALPVGPQLDWDPDIVAAMDEDFGFDDPNNQIDDDFVTQAMKDSAGPATADDDLYQYDFSYKSMDKMPKNIDDIEEEEEEYDDDDDLSICGAASSSGGEEDDEYYEAQDKFPDVDAKMLEMLKRKNFKQFFNVENMDNGEDDDRMTAKTGASTHFTEYSISSSTVPRNDQLKLLDDKFEQMFIREYADESAIGALDGDDELEEPSGIDPNQSELMAKLADEYYQAKQVHFGLEYEKNPDAVDYVRQHLKKMDISDEKNTKEQKEVKVEVESSEDDDSSTDTEYEEIEIEDPGRKGDKERFDCESVLSTFSNTNYHPRILRDTDRYGNVLLGRKSRSSHIRFDGRTGMPVGIMADKEADPTVPTAANLARLNEEATVRTSMSRLTELSFRPKNETPEERRARKKELKDFRAQRRAEKKANREAFAEESVRIHKTAMNSAVQKKIAVI